MTSWSNECQISNLEKLNWNSTESNTTSTWCTWSRLISCGLLTGASAFSGSRLLRFVQLDVDHWGRLLRKKQLHSASLWLITFIRYTIYSILLSTPLGLFIHLHCSAKKSWYNAIHPVCTDGIKWNWLDAEFISR